MNAELGKKGDRNSVICVDDKHRAAAPHVNYDCFEVLHVGFRGKKKMFTLGRTAWAQIDNERSEMCDKRRGSFLKPTR
jgi:hypothetical protein